MLITHKQEKNPTESTLALKPMGNSKSKTGYPLNEPFDPMTLILALYLDMVTKWRFYFIFFMYSLCTDRQTDKRNYLTIYAGGKNEKKKRNSHRYIHSKVPSHLKSKHWCEHFCTFAWLKDIWPYQVTFPSLLKFCS